MQNEALPPSKPWHEDIRFGLVLVVVLALANFVFFHLIPRLAPPVMQESISDIAAGPDTMPMAVQRTPSLVTTYAQPEEQQTIRRQLDLRYHDDASNALSISPRHIPPPQAQPLDHDEIVEMKTDNP